MGGYYWLLVVVGVALFMTADQSEASCDGVAGQNGAPGRDGWPGPKGEKGQPALMEGPVDPSLMLRQRGEPGSRGLQGVMGPKGYQGDVGAVGGAGVVGPPGPDGGSTGGADNPQQAALSAFSVMRTVNTYPRYEQVVTYQTTVVNQPNSANTPGDFNKDTGYFKCRIPGFYYFTFHSVAKVSMCLRIASDALTNQLGFCDYNRNQEQVLSGGVVLELAVDQRVWLQSFRDAQRDVESRDTQDKHIIFSGFLLF